MSDPVGYVIAALLGFILCMGCGFVINNAIEYGQAHCRVDFAE